MGGRARWVAGVVVVAALAAGFVVSDDAAAPASSVVAASHTRVSRRISFATPVTTTTTAPQPAAATGEARGGPGRVAVPNRVSVAAPSPWARYDGQLTGGPFLVARATGAALPVATEAGAGATLALANPLPSGAPRVVVVVAERDEWLQVLLPMRPNSSLGWVRRADVEVSSVHYRVEVDRAAHRIRVFDIDALVVDEPAAVGKPSTPTPGGQFFTVELLQPTNPYGAYGPYAFTLSAYSDVYQTFGSGDGAVGLHGTNESSSIGHDASHGCVRLHNDTIQRLAGMLPLGTPVYIR